MALLVLVVLSVAGFLNIESRIAIVRMDMAKAQLNAVASGRMALGQLQLLAGADQRVTAKADLFESGTYNASTLPYGTGATNSTYIQLTGTAPTVPYYKRNWTGVWCTGGADSSKSRDWDPRTPDEKVFLGWLVSPLAVKAADPTLADETKFPFVVPDRTLAGSADTSATRKGRGLINGTGPASLAVTTAPAGRLIPLLDLGSLKYTGRPTYTASVAGLAPTTDPDKVELPAMPLPGAVAGTLIGNYAWWVGDEGVKAKINLPDALTLTATAKELTSATTWDKKFRTQTGRNTIELMGTGVVASRPFNGFATWWDADVTATNTSGIGPLLSRVLNRSMLRNWAYTRGAGGGSAAADTAMTDALGRHYHDVTVDSYGVFSDTLNGGLRRDLSVAFELPFNDYTALTEFSDSPGDNGDINGKNTTWSSGFNMAATMNINATNTPSTLEWMNPERKLGFVYELPIPSTLWAMRSQAQSNPTSNGSPAIMRGPTWDLLRNFYRLYKREYESVSSTQRRGQPAPTSDAWIARGAEPFSYAIGDSTSLVTSYKGHPGYYAFRANPAMMSRKNAAGGGPYYPENYFIALPNLNSHANYGPGWGPISAHTSMKLAPNVVRTAFIFNVLWLGTTAADAKLGITMDPRVTIHNPYNVPLELNGMGLTLGKWYSMNFNFQRSDTGAQIGWMEFQPTFYYGRGLTFRILNNAGTLTNPTSASGDANVGPNGSIRLEPGEVRTFCASPLTTAQTGEVVYADATGTGEMKNIPGVFNYGSTGQSLVYRFPSPPDPSTFGGSRAIRVTAGFGYRADNPTANTTGSFLWETGQLDFHLAHNQMDNGTVVQAGARTWYGINNNPEGDMGDEHLMHRIQFLSRSLSTTVLASTDIAPNAPSPVPFAMVDIKARGWDDSSSTRQRPDTASPLFVNHRAQLLDYRVQDGDANGPAGWSVDFLKPDALISQFEMTGVRNNSYWGKSTTSAGGGQTNVVLYQVPTRPLLSLAGLGSVDYTHIDLQAGLTIGNSYCAPGLSDPAKLIEWPINSSGTVNGTTAGLTAGWGYVRQPRYDATWASNHALYDRYFFSGVFANEPSTYVAASGGPIPKVDPAQPTLLSDVFTTLQAGGKPLNNKRISWLIRAANTLADFKNPAKTAKAMLHDGSFNINSTSKEAWKAVLSGLRHQQLPGASKAATGLSPLSRFDKVIADHDATNTATRFRALTDTEIDILAEQIVIQVRLRGPFMSLSDFVNRRLVADAAANKDMGLKGPLQAAIDASGINNAAPYNGTFTTNASRHPMGKALSATSTEGSAQSALGAPGLLLQSDILNAMGSSLSARSDTFVIRAYGESVDSLGRPGAGAWLELTVQRMPEMIVPDDNEPNITPTTYRTLTANTDATNSIFMDKFSPNPSIKKPNRFLGRRFKIVATRWLGPNEI